MNRIALLSLLSILFSISLPAQSSQQLLFKLNDQQLEQLLTRPLTRLYLPGDKVRKKRHALMLTSPLDTLPLGQEPLLQNQEPGAYLLTYVKGDYIYSELFTKTEIEEIQLIPEENRSLLFVKAPPKVRDQMEIHYQGHPLDFNEELGAYVIHGRKMRGVLKIMTDKETRMMTYFRSKARKEKKFFIYNAHDNVLVENTQYYKRDYHGFLLVNQPRYRPGDTLRFKALIFALLPFQVAPQAHGDVVLQNLHQGFFRQLF